MMMGFPKLVHAPYPGLCSCHGKLKSVGYSCPRCKSRICDVPTECRVCGLTVVNAPQLARSYRHLFPVCSVCIRVPLLSLTDLFSSSQVANYEQVSVPSADHPLSCYSCAFPFTTVTTSLLPPSIGDLSPLGRYACKTCSNHFCLDCDKLVHDALGFCPGCC